MQANILQSYAFLILILFRIHLSNCSLEEEHNFEFKIFSPSEYMKINVGQFVEFQCTVSDPEKITGYYWSHANIISQNENCFAKNCQTGKKDENTVFLLLSDISLENQGEYKCQVVWNNVVRTLNHTLVVIASPTITDFGTIDFNLKEGEDLSIFCDATGIPEPSVAWLKYDYVDYEYSWAPVSEDGPSFTITDAQRSHASQYKCLAKNEAGETEKAINVHILFKPTALVDYDRVHCGVSYQCTLECRFDAYDKVEVEWSFPGVWEPPVNWKQSVTGSLTSWLATLTIQQASPENIGWYTCTGTNSMGSDSARVELTFTPTTPIITSLDRKNYYPDRYLLEWSVTSFAKLKSFETVFHWVQNETSTIFLKNITLKAREISLPLKYHTIQMPIETPNYIQSEMLSSLRTASKYSVQMRAHNQFGYSDWSPVGYFYTAGRPYRNGGHSCHSPALAFSFVISLTLKIIFNTFFH